MKSNIYLDDNNIAISMNDARLLRQLAGGLEEMFDSVGLLYRLFYRTKSPDSTNKKISEKKEIYISENRKLQDVFGIRVTVYFSDDLELAAKLVKTKFEELPSSHSIDKFADDHFGPIRYNLVFRLPQSISDQTTLFTNPFIDSTFEVQFRTMFSEGWHEVEHDMRYKCKADWIDEDILNRLLNSQLAVLESCDWALLKIFDEMSFKKYHGSEWSSFFRNLLRIRFKDNSLSESITSFMDSNRGIAKELIKHNRLDLVLSLSKLSVGIPLTMDTVMFCLNRAILKNDHLKEMEPAVIKSILDDSVF